MHHDWLDLDHLARRFARLALGAAFLSGIASRFGLWGRDVGYGDFAHFVTYTAQVNSFMPGWSIPYLAWVATVAELGLGVLLVLGVRWRWVSWGSAALLALFGLAMAVSFGLKSPLDYSVFSASAAALLLAVDPDGMRRRRPFLVGPWPLTLLIMLARGARPADGAWPAPTAGTSAAAIHA